MDASPVEMLGEGESFHGYVIKRLLGKGGLGAVYLARHEILDSDFAIKVLPPGTDPEFVKRFLREAKLATRLRHRNLVAVHDCGVDERRGLYFLVMDYVDGGDLRQEIAFSGRIERTRALDIVYQVASALSEAERYGVVHRDIKPENIMIDASGVVKVVDLGVAKADGLNDSLRTTAKTVFGTPAYVSPEQAIDASRVDVRADIYSLGVVFFEMLTGRCPYEGKTMARMLQQILSEDPMPDVRDVQPDVPAEYADLVRRMCAKDRECRISDTATLLAEIERLRGGTRPQEAVRSAASLLPPRTMAEYINSIPDAEADVRTFETEDREIQAVVDRLRRRKRLNRIRKIVAMALAAILTVGLVVLVWRVSHGNG